MATTVEVPVGRTVRRQAQQRFKSSLGVCVGLLLAVTALLAYVAVSRSSAPGSTPHRTGTQVVPNPTPGPFGS